MALQEKRLKLNSVLKNYSKTIITIIKVKNEVKRNIFFNITLNYRNYQTKVYRCETIVRMKSFPLNYIVKHKMFESKIS